MGKPDAGNPPVRFDEGDQVSAWSLLYRRLEELPERGIRDGDDA